LFSRVNRAAEDDRRVAGQGCRWGGSGYVGEAACPGGDEAVTNLVMGGAGADAMGGESGGVLDPGTVTVAVGEGVPVG
jgi:hypothetical protein